MWPVKSTPKWHDIVSNGKLNPTIMYSTRLYLSVYLYLGYEERPTVSEIKSKRPFASLRGIVRAGRTSVMLRRQQQWSGANTSREPRRTSMSEEVSSRARQTHTKRFTGRTERGEGTVRQTDRQAGVLMGKWQILTTNRRHQSRAAAAAARLDLTYVNMRKIWEK